MNGFIIMLVRCCSRFAACHAEAARRRVRSAVLKVCGTRALRLSQRGDYSFAGRMTAATGRNE